MSGAAPGGSNIFVPISLFTYVQDDPDAGQHTGCSSGSSPLRWALVAVSRTAERAHEVEGRARTRHSIALAAGRRFTSTTHSTASRLSVSASSPTKTRAAHS